jgi:LCP family protein required for cell wall assembly
LNASGVPPCTEGDPYPAVMAIQRPLTRRARILIGLGVVVGVVVLFMGWQGVRAYMAWNSVERVPFDLDEARSALTTIPADAGSTTTTLPPPVVGYDAVLVIGSDEKPPEHQEEIYADALLLYLMPDDGSGPLIVSIPRDLVVIDPCTGSRTKLDRTLTPCDGGITAPEHVALTVEDYTGIGIDHYSLLKFDALTQIVDSVGGVTICSEHALREGTLDLVPAGCSEVDGEHALAWIRSRRTQELVDGQWRFIDNVGDAARVERQQELLFALFDELKGIRSPANLAGLAGELGDTIVLSETLGIGDAVALAWDLRSRSSIRTLTVPTEPTTLPDGSFAVRATVPFSELLAG